MICLVPTVVVVREKLLLKNKQHVFIINFPFCLSLPFVPQVHAVVVSYEKPALTHRHRHCWRAKILLQNLLLALHNHNLSLLVLFSFIETFGHVWVSRCELRGAFDECACAKAHFGPFGNCEKASYDEKNLPSSSQILLLLVVVVEKSRFVIILSDWKMEE